MKGDALTTEELRKKFKNNFDLCSFAINVARTSIQGGQQAALSEVLKKVDHRSSESQEE